MTTQKLSIVIVLTVAICSVCMGCQPAIQPSVENQKDSSKLIRFKIDNNSIRMRLLATKLVQKDLCLTPDQIKKLRSLYEIHSARACEIYERLRDEISHTHASQLLSKEEVEAGTQRVNALLENLESEKKKFHTKSFAILTPDQTERLKQIQIQATIPEAFQRPEIIKALHLSEEQLEKIRTLRAQVDQKQEANWPDLNNLNQEKKIELLKTVYQDAVDTTNHILDLLIPEQRIALEKLTGKKLDLTQLYDTWIENAKSSLDSTNLETSQENETVSNPF